MSITHYGGNGMITSKTALGRTLRSLHLFDPMGSPFVGIQWSGQGLAFHRTGMTGLIESTHYDRSAKPTIVHLGHFRDVLQLINSEEVKVDVDRASFLRVTSVGSYDTELRVHTAHPDTCWSIHHTTGEPQIQVPVDTFKDIDISGIPTTGPPIHKQNKLMVPSVGSVVTRRQVPSTGAVHPREGLLKVLAGQEPQELYVTDTQYWAAVLAGLRILVSGHKTCDAIFDTYNVPSIPLSELPAPRLIYALKAASSLAQDGGRLQLDPKTGISTRDEHGNPGTFSLGPCDHFTPFFLPVRTAKVMVEILSQSKEEVVVLSTLNRDTYRMSRGLWDVSFRL